VKDGKTKAAFFAELADLLERFDVEIDVEQYGDSLTPYHRLSFDFGLASVPAGRNVGCEDAKELFVKLKLDANTN